MMTKYQVAQLLIGAALLTTAFYVGINSKKVSLVEGGDGIALADEGLELRTPLLPRSGGSDASAEPSPLDDSSQRDPGPRPLPEKSESSPVIRKPDFSALARGNAAEKSKDNELAILDSLSGLHGDSERRGGFAAPPTRDALTDGSAFSDRDRRGLSPIGDREPPALLREEDPAGLSTDPRSLADSALGQASGADQQRFRPLLPLAGDEPTEASPRGRLPSVLDPDSSIGQGQRAPERSQTAPVQAAFAAETVLRPIRSQSVTVADLPNSSFRIHVVRTGESLQTIAFQYYRSRKYYLEIYLANQDVLESPIQLAPGTTLRIPDLEIRENHDQ